MARLRDKLNVFVQSSVRGALRDAVARPRKPLSLSRQDRDLAALRQQINAALDDEDRMVQEIAAFRAEIAAWDQEADRLLQTGDIAGARHQVRQIQLKRQQLTMREADLYQHRRAAAELIRRANILEAVLAEARSAQTAPTQAPAEEREEVDPSLTVRLQQIRERVAQAAAEAAPAPPQTAPVDEQTVDDDLARRRARLSLGSGDG